MKKEIAKQLAELQETVYCAPGLMEFRMRCKMGGATLVVDFTGGKTMGSVTRWATFSTGDPVVKRVIERSHEFSTGRVRWL